MAGDKLAVNPGGNDAVDSATAALNPPLTATDTFRLPAPPCVTASPVEGALIWNEGMALAPLPHEFTRRLASTEPNPVAKSYPAPVL